MIEKITDFGSLSGVLSPLLPLIYTDAVFSQNDLDGAFIQKNNNEKIQAVFSLKNTCVNLICFDNVDFEELISFFNFCSVTEVLSDKPIPDVVKDCKQLNLLEFIGDVPKETHSVAINSKSIINEYEKVYDIVFEKGNNFENWFPEFSKKINSYNANATYLKVNEKVVSAALAPSILGNCAIIAGVFTLEEFRKKGYAKDCVDGVLRELLNNNVSKIYLWCEEDNLPFYEKSGFKAVDKIYFGVCK